MQCVNRLMNVLVGQPAFLGGIIDHVFGIVCGLCKVCDTVRNPQLAEATDAEAGRPLQDKSTSGGQTPTPSDTTIPTTSYQEAAWPLQSFNSVLPSKIN